MRSGNLTAPSTAPSGMASPRSKVLLVSADTQLQLDLERIFNARGLCLRTAKDGEAAIASFDSLEDAAGILLDARLDWVASGRLLAAIHESGIHRRCAIALIAEQVSEEWIQRVREGMVDGIVPRSANESDWKKHWSTIQRVHRLLCELEELRAATLMTAKHDPLTGLFNRETMLTLLFRETDRVQRLRGALCLLIFDVDGFAHWNAELGETACDGLLREVAARTGRLLRSYDVLGRTGADEFLLALPGCSTVNAAMLADRLRMEVFGEPFAVQTESKKSVAVQITASFGIAASRGRSPVVVMREVERTLALARQAGPDTIRGASETEAGSLEMVANPAG